MNQVPASITAALEAFAPALAARYDAMVRRQHALMVARYGVSLRGIGSDFDMGRTYFQIVSPALTNGAINEDRLTTLANAYAADAVQSWSLKIAEKIGNLTNVTVSQMTLDACQFVINGFRGDDKVTIEQTIITKSSTKGLVFNQFPARIYLNGKFISEAAFKKLG